MQRLYMPRNEQKQRALSPREFVRETKLRFDAKLCEEVYAKRMTAKHARTQAPSCFSKGLPKCSRLNASLPSTDCAKFEYEYCVCEASCASAATPTPSPNSPPTVASPMLLQKEYLPQSMELERTADDAGTSPFSRELAHIVEGERKQTREEKDEVVQRCCRSSSDARQRLIASRRKCSDNSKLSSPSHSLNENENNAVSSSHLEDKVENQLMKDVEHTTDNQMGSSSSQCTTPPPQLSLRRHVSCLRGDKKKTTLRKRVSFTKDTKCHDGLAMEQHCLDNLIWNYFVRNTLTNFDDVTALVASAVITHMDGVDTTAGRTLAAQSCLQKLMLLLLDLKHRVKSTGIAPVLPGGGGFGAKLEVRHLADVDELRNMVSKAKDMALAASRGHTASGCLNAINLKKDSLGSPRSRNSMMVTGMAAENAGHCSPVGSPKHVNTASLSSC